MQITMFQQTPKKTKKRTGSRNFFGDGNSSSFQFDSLGLLLSDLCIAALLLILPFIMGGREAWGHRFLISVALLLGLSWSLHKFQKGGRLLLLSIEPILIAGLFLVWFQTIPQPPSVLEQASTEYSRLLPTWAQTQSTAASESAQSSAPAAWNTLSFIPTETRHAFLVLLAYGIIGIVVAQRIQSEKDWQQLVRLVSISGILMAAFAVLQLATSNDRFFWFYRHPFTGTREVLKGAFTNRNHFAQFLVLSLGPLIWWALSERRNHQEQAVNQVRQGLGPAQGNHSNFDNLISIRLILLLCSIAGVLMCVFLSLSRGGMAASVIAIGVACTALLRNASARKSLSLALPAIGFLLVFGLMFVGGDTVDVRVNQLASGDVNKLDTGNARRTIWKADLEASSHFPIFGTGVGSHREVYPIYMTEFADFSTFEFTHAESTYVNLLLETGLAGLGLLVLGLVAVLGRFTWKLIRPADPGQTEYVAAITASILAGAAHATADFIWYAPAIVVTTVVLAVAGLRMCSGFQHERGITVPRIFWLGPAVASGIALFVVQPGLAQRVAGEKHWHQFLIATLDEQRDVADAAARMEFTDDNEFAMNDQTGDGNGTNLSDYRQDESNPDDKNSSTFRRINMLLKSLQAFPDQPRVQLALATISLQLFDSLQKDSDNPLGLSQIRDTVRSSEFESKAAMHEWLNRAFGKTIRLPVLADKMARQSLGLCPIQGRAYLVLAETSFLQDPANSSSESIMNQALLVRAYDPRVRFAAGQELLLPGKQSEAIEQWSAVFHTNSMYREAITSVFSRMVPPTFVIEQFSPTASEMTDVLAVYRKNNRPQDLKPIFTTLRTQFEQPIEDLTEEAQVNLLMDAFDSARQFGMHEECEAFLTRAIEIDEHAYRPHRALGLLYFEQERYTEAAQILLWCYEQQPGDAALGRLISDARKRAMQSEQQTLPASYPTENRSDVYQTSQSKPLFQN